MSMLAQLNELFEELNIPVETGEFSSDPPAFYVVLTPLTDDFGVYGDNKPLAETQEVRISLFNYGNYLERKEAIVAALLDKEFTITLRQYIGFDKETGYHTYTIDVMKEFNLEKED